MTVQRRTVGVVAGVALALLGTFGLVAYVQGAKDRAVAGEKLVTVYVTDGEISAGTPAREVADDVRKEEVPTKVRADDAVTDLDQISGDYAAVNLVAGEQLVKSRFVSDRSKVKPTAARDVPPGLFAGTLALEPEEALGGEIVPGDRVAVVATNTEAADNSATKSVVIARNALVTRVQIDGTEGGEKEATKVTQGPEGRFFITVALSQEDLEEMVAATVKGTVWLAADQGDPR
jgi:pilus assembly protein CpaB